MRTRVAIVLPYFGAGGGEHMVSRLAAHLDLSKVEAEVICIFGEPQNNELEKRLFQCSYQEIESRTVRISARCGTYSSICMRLLRRMGGNP